LVLLFPRAHDDAPRVWQIRGTAVVGRGRRAFVSLDDVSVSREHANLETRPGGLWVGDIESRHGSFIGGQRVSNTGALAPYGSVVRFGNTVMLAVDDVEIHRAKPRRMSGKSLGLPKDIIAGPTLAQVWDQAARVAQLNDAVLVLGESGSGKECVARIIHGVRPQPGPFVGINVAAIPETLFEAELFGYERGAFTGAATARAGAFREANGGVLFLDEVGDLRADLQAKLLRVIDQGCVRPLGANRDIPVNFRLVTATNRDLREACRDGEFRTDLYYRLAPTVVRVPPLRERRDEILLLATSILEDHAADLGMAADTAEALLLAHWEGNVRNLRYAISHAAAKAIAGGSKEIRPRHLPDLSPIHLDAEGLTEDRIRTAMKKADGNASRAAEALGVSRTTLYNAMKRLNIDAPSLRGKR
jgi:transcriptional regulator with PAS, ATPase and Fis domain